EKSRQVVCSANLRSIGQAFSMYADTFGGVWPAAVEQPGTTENRWPVPFINSRILQLEFNDTRSVFICPSEGAPRAIADWLIPGQTVDRVEVGGSYAYSGEVHRMDDGPLQVGSMTEPPFHRPVDHCTRPSEVFTLTDNARPLQAVTNFGWRFYRDTERGEAFFQGYRFPNGDPVPPTFAVYRIIGNRHRGICNVLAIDTHVESIRPETMKFDQVSWKPWPADSEGPPPGGQ
ncbi:MAG: hypothetical protein ACE5EC_10305, partial [Phycisphaerae bacterium]